MERQYNFRLRLKSLRENKGISQYKLADDLGVSQARIGHWESGTRECNFETLILISKYFGVTIDYLLGASDLPYGDNATYDTELAPEAEDERRILDLYRAVKEKGGNESAIKFIDLLSDLLLKKGE